MRRTPLADDPSDDGLFGVGNKANPAVVLAVETYFGKALGREVKAVQLPDGGPGLRTAEYNYCQDGGALTRVASMRNVCLANPILYCCFENVDFYVC
jgi:hypothetical protein